MTTTDVDPENEAEAASEPRPFFDSDDAPSPNGNVRTLASPSAWLERASDLLKEPDPGPTPFLVDQLIADQSIAMLVGPAKARKTWTLLELAIAIVTGRTAFGKYEIPVPGAVIIVLEESGRAALHRRLDALTRGNQIDPNELHHLHYAANLGVRLDNADWQDRLLDAGRQIRPRCIFLDPLVRLKGATRDENKQNEIGPVLDYMRALRDDSQATVGFVHHTGHEGSHARGSSDFEGYWESKLKITRDAAGTTVNIGHREAEEPPAFTYAFDWDHATRSVRLPAQAEPELDPDVLDTVRIYLAQHPQATANQVVKAIKANRPEVLKAVKAIRDDLVPGTTEVVPGTT